MSSRSKRGSTISNVDKKNLQDDGQSIDEKKPPKELKEDEDILNLLPRKNLSQIEKQFPKEGGLSEKEFVSTLLEHLEYDKNDKDKKLQITLNLIDLFKEIDVNGDETMEWVEFSNYIIELGMIKKDKNIGNVIKNYNPSEGAKDTVKHENEIEKIFFFEKTKQVFVLERDSPNFKVYDDTTFQLIADIPAHKGSILAADCFQDDNKNQLIVTTSDDLTINFWEASNFSLKQRISTPELQLCVKHVQWNKDLSLIYTGGSDALIHYYDAKTYKQKGHLSGWNPFFKKDTQQFGHAGPITDLLPIKNQQTLVSCATDGKICLWDIPSHAYKKDLLGHEKGVFSLDWSEKNSILFSAGLDHEAYVWNTYVSEKINLLRGHNHPLIGVKVIPDTPQIITGDISGMIKIWDIRNFLCVQTFNVPCEELNSFTVTHPKKRIIAGARTLQFFDYDEPKDQNLTDEKICLKVLYNDIMFSFITLHPDCIKIWEAKSGKLLTIHREISPGIELSACCLDHRKRKLVVGDVEGNIICINVKNGAEMKRFESHGDESHPEQITDLVYWVNDEKTMKLHVNSKIATEILEAEKKPEIIPRLVSCSKGKTVKVHDDSSAEEKHCRYKAELHQDVVNGLALNPEKGQAASYSDDGSISLINIGSYRQDGVMKPTLENEQKNLPEIKRACYLTPHYLVLSCDSEGKLVVWARNQPIFLCYYEIISMTRKLEKFSVNVMVYNQEKEYLYIGDLFGNIAIWDLSKVLKKLTDLYYDINKWNLFEDAVVKTRSQKHPTEINSKIEQKFEIQDSAFITALPFEIPGPSDVRKVMTIEGAHDDGITWIEIIPEYDSFATASFDCKVHIWNHETSEKKKPVGSLMMAQDANWKFKVKEEERLNENKTYSSDLLYEIETGLKRGKDHSNIPSERKLVDREDDKEADDNNVIGVNKTPILSRQHTMKSRGEREMILLEAKARLEKFDMYKDYSGSYIQNMATTSEDKDIFADDDEEDQDYQILHDLDFKAGQMTTSINKGLFKSNKPIKSHVKLKFKS